MNRIYQGRVSGVSTLNPDSNAAPELRWLPRNGWETELWKHHALFQTAVNYYTLCLAAMARGIDEPEFLAIALKVAEDSARRDPKHKTDAARQKAIESAAETAKAMIAAVKGWRDEVAKTWVQGERRGKKMAGGYAEVAPILGVPVVEKADGPSAFASCAAKALEGSKATRQEQAAAFLRLLELAGTKKTDANKLARMCGEKIVFFCSANTRAGDDATANSQIMERQKSVKSILHATPENLSEVAAGIDLRFFYRTPPQKPDHVGEKAVKRLLDCFDGLSLPKKAKKKTKPPRFPELAVLRSEFHGRLLQLAKEEPARLAMPDANKPPAEMAPTAVFKFMPRAETWDVCKRAVASVALRKVEQIGSKDPLAALGGETFAYFTNIAFHRDAGAKQRAAWFEFDLAAFVEAMKSPHRYYQDSQAREKAARVLEEELQAMEGEGRAGSADEGAGAKAALDGFRDDVRVDRLLAVLFSDLGHLGEVDTPEDDKLSRPFITAAITRLKIELPENSREYTLRERTLRSWRAVRDGWRDLVEKKKEPTKEDLWAVVAKEQGEHRKDFGSARFYEALTEPGNQCIWRPKGTHDFHAEDVVAAWAEYTELRRELRDKQRPIRFTPAHAKDSPRFFNFPKKAGGGKWGSDHKPLGSADARVAGDKPGTLSFTAGVAIRDGAKWRVEKTRITYYAPRLRRDGMRRDGEESLDAAPWLPPMIAAMGLAEPPAQDFGNCRITLQPHAFEDKDGVERYSIQLTFPVEIQAEKLIEQIKKQALWAKRFNLTPDGESFRESTLRREHEKQPKERPRPLEEVISRFTFGSVDFGLHADSWALHEARLDGNFGSNKKGRPIISRAITTGEEAPWRLATRDVRKLRLPGNDATVWRKREDNDAGRKREDEKGEWDFREELYGDCGRSASEPETADCRELMCALLGERWGWEFASHTDKMPDDWKTQMDGMLAEFSFPEQNDKLIVVARRAQSRLARIARWRSGVAEDARWESTLKELRQTCGFEDKDGKPPEPKPDGTPAGEQWIPSPIRDAAKEKDRDALKTATRSEHKNLIGTLPPLLVRIANRVLPLRGRSWEWERVEDQRKEGRLHGLEQSGPKIPDVLLAGQRGLSIMRIEQIEELRRRFQSFNQAERRHHAAEQVEKGEWLADTAKTWVRRDFTDPCADLLDKLDEIKTQRVNQSAHMILAQMLGVRLAKPPPNKKELRDERDQHGVYEKFREPVDFVAIEDLSRYRASQGRAPQENGRLMKWCHRAVRDKLRQLCEPFGIPVLEVPAAYSSQFCSRSGVIGFRAEEVTEGFEKRAPWLLRLRVKDGEEKTAEQAEMEQLAAELSEAQKVMEREWRKKHGTGVAPKVTVVLPKQGGQIFVPIIAAEAQGNRLAAKVTDSDLNAAVNIGLRAVADPRMWEFFPRLRTTRVSGAVSHKGRKPPKAKQAAAVASGANPTEAKIVLAAREKRKYGEKGPELSLGDVPGGSAARETKQPNYFRDFADLSRLLRQAEGPDDAEGKRLLGFAREFVRHDKAHVPDPAAPAQQVEILSSKALFMALKRLQWSRCMEINRARIQQWERDGDDVQF